MFSLLKNVNGPQNISDSVFSGADCVQENDEKFFLAHWMAGWTVIASRLELTNLWLWNSSSGLKFILCLHPFPRSLPGSNGDIWGRKANLSPRISQAGAINAMFDWCVSHCHGRVNWTLCGCFWGKATTECPWCDLFLETRWEAHRQAIIPQTNNNNGCNDNDDNWSQVCRSTKS